MLLETFNQEEKIAFAALAKQLVMADNVLDERESLMIDAIYQEMELDYNITLPDKSLEELAKYFQKHSSQIFCIMELSTLALIDNDYAQEESVFIGKLIRCFGIEKNIHKQILTWSEIHIQQMKQVKTFLKVS